MSLTYYSASDLNQFGVNYLTGESCRYGMRVLCDLSKEGVELICDFMGLPADTKFAENWNTMVGTDAPAVASVMLARETLKPLAKFAMIRAGALWVVHQNDSTLHGYTAEDMSRWGITEERLREVYPSVKYVGPLSAGSRNTHAMSGRTI